MCERIRKTNYDANNDIIYLTFEKEKGSSYADEGPLGIEIMRDWDTEEMTGLMVYYPKTQIVDRQKKLNELGLNFRLLDFLN